MLISIPGMKRSWKVPVSGSCVRSSAGYLIHAEIWGAVGHNDEGGGDARNPFGRDFAAAGYVSSC